MAGNTFNRKAVGATRVSLGANGHSTSSLVPGEVRAFFDEHA